VADGGDRDRLPPLLDSIDEDVVTENKTPQIGLHLVVKRAAESRELGEILDAVEEIGRGATSRGCVRKEIEDSAIRSKADSDQTIV
jgi:hypothetical protein